MSTFYIKETTTWIGQEEKVAEKEGILYQNKYDSGDFVSVDQFTVKTWSFAEWI